MPRSFAALALLAALPLVAGCDTQPQGVSAMGAQAAPIFIAANSSTVVVDVARSDDAQLEQARAVAGQKCGLFGGNGAVLESLNVVANGRERASFLCR